MKMQVESLKLAPVFFEALDYPGYAQPEFFIHKQKQSDWSKGVYLTTLNEIYHSYIQRIQIHFGAKKRSNPNLAIEDIKLSPKEIDGVQTERLVSKKELDSLHYAVQAAAFVVTDPYQLTHPFISYLLSKQRLFLFIRNFVNRQKKQMI